MNVLAFAKKVGYLDWLLVTLLAGLPVGAVAIAMPDIGKDGVIVLLQALFLGVIMGIVVGIIPLIIGYIASEFITLRFIRKTEASAGHENDG